MGGTDAQQETDTGSARLRPWAVSVPLAALFAVLYARHAGRPLDYDSAETVGVFVRADSLLDALRLQRAFNNHPLFSLLESAWTRMLGSTDEAVLRVLPIAFGLIAVGVLAWVVTKRWGVAAGAAAGIVLGSNPLFSGYARAVRGYSLVVLGLVLATALLLHLLARERPALRAEVGYVVFSAVAIATHLFAVLALSGHVVVVVSNRKLDRRWIGRWALAAVLGSLAYLGIIWGMLGALGDRGRVFRPFFLWDLLVELMGSNAMTAGIVTIGAALGVAVVARLWWWNAAVPIWLAVAILLPWVGGNSDLAPRFLIWLVPVVAAVVAAAVSRWQLLLLPVVLAGTVAAAPMVRSGSGGGHPYPEAAALVDRTVDEGGTACVTNLSAPPLLAYSGRFQPITESGEADVCDVVISVHPDLYEDLIDAIGERRGAPVPLRPGHPAVVWDGGGEPE